MAYSIIKADEPLPPKKIVAVLYGPPGTYKTSTSFTAPNALLFNFDDGLHRAVKRGNAINFEKWEDCVEFCASKDFQDLDPETLIFDTGGALLDDFMAASVIREDTANRKKSGGLSITGYGSLKNKFDQFFAQFRGKKNVIFLCHEQEDKKNDVSIVRPKMTGGAYAIMIAKADLIGYMDVVKDENGKDIVKIDFNPSQERYAKNFAQFQPMAVPHYSSPEFDTFMTVLFDDAQKKMAALSQEQQEAIKTMEEIRDRIADCKVRQDVEEIEEQISNMSKTYQLQLVDTFNEKKAEIMIEEFDLIENFEGVLKLFNSEIVKLKKPVYQIIEEPFLELIKSTWIADNIQDGEMKVEQFNKMGDEIKTFEKFFIPVLSPVLLEQAEKKGFITIKGEKGFHPVIEEPKESEEPKDQKEPEQATEKHEKAWDDLPEELDKNPLQGGQQSIANFENEGSK